MQALVHFVVGMSAALFLLGFVDRAPHKEVTLAVVSGFWALVPDGYWLLLELGIETGTGRWQALHGSEYANVFWLHGLVDSLETGRPNLQAGIALAAFVGVVLWYYAVSELVARRASV